MIWQDAYQHAEGCVSWHGHRAGDEAALNGFLQGPVAARLNDAQGRESLAEHLQGLSLTGMGQDALQAVLAAEVPEARAWAAGEALAEAVLEEQHGVTFPWNTERDKRNPFASLPGADIVGFQQNGASHRLALGEVKSSSEAKWPPQVMSGRSGGMAHQLDTLATNLTMIWQLLKWLLPRVKGTKYEPAFDAACTRYLNSGHRDLVLFGVLVRDQKPDANDLQKHGKDLAGRLRSPTCCKLMALYLPWSLSDLPSHIGQGGAA